MIFVPDWVLPCFPIIIIIGVGAADTPQNTQSFSHQNRILSRKVRDLRDSRGSKVNVSIEQLRIFIFSSLESVQNMSYGNVSAVESNL